MKKLYIYISILALAIFSSMSQSIVSINVVEKKINNGWVPQNYIVVSEKSGTNYVVLFDKNYKLEASAYVVGKTRMGIPNTHNGNYRMRKL